MTAPGPGAKNQVLVKFQFSGRWLGTQNMVNGILNDTLMTTFYPAIASMDEICLTFAAKF